MEVVESSIPEQKIIEGVGSFPFVFSPKDTVQAQEQV